MCEKNTRRVFLISHLLNFLEKNAHFCILNLFQAPTSRILTQMKYAKYYLICLLIVLLDHASKLAVHFNMRLGEEVVVFDWFRIHYLLNPGMAFGMEFTFLANGKLFLSIFRVLATAGIGYYLYAQAKKGVHKGFLVCLALILGGAIGNAIDSIFYGVVLEGNAIIGANTPWFHGRVIDMLYFPLFDGYFPDWIPHWGGRYFSFFSAIFNIADSSIFIGAASILLFQKRFFASDKKENQGNATNNTAHEAQDRVISEARQHGDSMVDSEEGDNGEPGVWQKPPNDEAKRDNDI